VPILTLEGLGFEEIQGRQFVPFSGRQTLSSLNWTYWVPILTLEGLGFEEIQGRQFVPFSGRQTLSSLNWT
jgi:virulence-associated protein VapD